MILMRKLILGLVIGLLIGTAGTALASTDYVRATFSEFKLKVNGESIELENNPLLVEGTTYWPIRELSNYLGFDIDYEDETRTILVDTEELDEVINETEVDGNDTDYSLDSVNSKIESLEKLIYFYTRNLERMDDLSDEVRRDYLNLKSQYESELEFWLEKKDELESQQ